MDRASRHELHTTQAQVTGTARHTGWTENELRFLAILDFSRGDGPHTSFLQVPSRTKLRPVHKPSTLHFPFILSFDAKQSSVMP